MIKKTKKTINKETKIKEKRNKGKVSNLKKEEKKERMTRTSQQPIILFLFLIKSTSPKKINPAKKTLSSRDITECP